MAITVAIRFLYDGDALAIEYSSAGAVTKRYVHGSNAAADDPLLDYDGAGLASRRYLETDHQGSVILIANASGATVATNRYDEYGVPQASNQGRFQYTGQAWLSELQLYHYKARLYDPRLGRFLQVDPIGYDDQFNLYAYVGNDPVNRVDPTGTIGDCDTGSLGGRSVACRVVLGFTGPAVACSRAPVCRTVIAEAARQLGRAAASAAKKLGIDREEKQPQLLYRGITPRDVATMRSGQGITATNPSATLTPDQHIASKIKPSQFISTTKNPEVAATYASTSTQRVAVIDASRLPTKMDFSRGSWFLSLKGNYLAIRDAEVLIPGFIPQAAIVGVIPVGSDDDE